MIIQQAELPYYLNELKMKNIPFKKKLTAIAGFVTYASFYTPLVTITGPIAFIAFMYFRLKEK